MSQKYVKQWDRFIGGIADYQHESLTVDAYYFGRSIDVRSEPHHIGVLPRTVKESGTVIEGLPKWGEVYESTMDTYIYDGSGNIYKRTSTRTYSKLRSVANSHGNGLCYSAEDNFLYYTLDSVVGRYGPLSATTPTFVDDFFGSQGGVPLNTNSLDLEASSSQYASMADSASLSITGDLSIEVQIKPESLPATSASMVLFSKWNSSGTTRSYKFDIYAASGYFGSGADGALTISSDTTEAPIDSVCTGTTATTTLSATNTSFAADQVILIHQSQGTGAGTWQRNEIFSYTAGTITLKSNLNATYATGAQVRVLKQYTDVTINTTKTYTAKAWGGTVGGILAFIASGTVTVTGTITATGKGFRGGASNSGSYPLFAYTGEGTTGVSALGTSTTPNGNGAGASYVGNNQNYRTAGSGGGNGSAGTPGRNYGGSAEGGSIAGTADLTTMVFGGGGGGGVYALSGLVGAGSAGGGIIFITAATLTVAGTVVSGGTVGIDGTKAPGGGGSGGSILLKAQTATLGALLITASGGAGGGGAEVLLGEPFTGGAGGDGRIHLDYYTSYTGTTTPTLDVVQDDNLASTTNSYQLRLQVSSTGDNSESYSMTFNPVLSEWQEVGVTWDASASTATFYLNAVSLGTRTGALTAIHNNASRSAVGCSYDDAGSAANFYDGLIDEVRVFNLVRTEQNITDGYQSQIAVNTYGLVAYYKLNGDVNDATANANNLTATGSPVYSSDVPYPSPTTRLDIDQYSATAGQVYTLTTAINEGATHRKTFTPAKDPQKSIASNIIAVGTGDWTITVHDTYNNVMASKTVVNALLYTGYFEFLFSSTWSPLTNFTNNYHFHITSTVADGTVETSGAEDLETVDYKTYYQFLVTNAQWHPIKRFLNFIVIGNGRHVAIYEAPTYTPNRVVLGAGWTVRCFDYWQEYIAIGCQKGSNIYDTDLGRVYFWDGYSAYANFWIDIPEGGVNALLGARGTLNIWAGYHADLLEYSGGAEANKVKEVPLLTADKYAEVYPGAVTMWQANIRYGLAGGSDSTDIQKGVYTWGSTNNRYPDILTYDYPISTGTYSGNNLKIGMVLPVNKELLIGWQDNVSYGIDYVNVANNPYPSATVEMMIEDLETPYKDKEALLWVATFDELESGCSVSLKYRNDETDTDWHTNSDTYTTDAVMAKQLITAGRFKHIRLAADITSSGTNHPTIKSLALLSDLLENEQQI